MKKCNKCAEVKPLTEFYKHKKNKDRLSYTCIVCHNSIRKEYYQQNKQKEIDNAIRWSQENKDKKRDYYKKYYKNNRHKEIERSRNKQLTRENRTPSWAEDSKIKTVYEEAQYLTKSTGIVHHVDHIIPLQGKFVSGLHVHENLQVLPADENISKSNKYDPIKTDIGV